MSEGGDVKLGHADLPTKSLILLIRWQGVRWDWRLDVEADLATIALEDAYVTAVPVIAEFDRTELSGVSAPFVLPQAATFRGSVIVRTLQRRRDRLIASLKGAGPIDGMAFPKPP